MNPIIAKNIAEEMLREQDSDRYAHLDADELGVISKTSQRFLGIPLVSLNTDGGRETTLQCPDQAGLLDRLCASDDQRGALKNRELTLRIVRDSDEEETRRCFLYANPTEHDSDEYPFMLFEFWADQGYPMGDLSVPTGRGHTSARVGSPELRDIEVIADSFIPAQE